MQSPRITVRVAADGLTARVSIVRGEAASLAELTQALAAADVSFGLDQTALDELGQALGDEAYELSERVVAHALHPTLGVHGRFVPAFQPGIQPGHLRADGSMDFFDRELLKPITSGELLGQLLPPRHGEPGRKLDGSLIPAIRVHEAQLVLGSGVARDESGQLHALRSGVLAYLAGKSLDVVNQHTHQGDVDLRSGHLDMQGSLRVQKSVLRPFRAQASGDVEVLGRVDGGSVRAGGSIRIKGPVQGAASSLHSEGDISLGQVERASVYCSGLLQVQSAVHCQLRAERIEAAGKLHGGSACAELSLMATELTASAGVETLVGAAIPLASAQSVVLAVHEAKAERAAAQRVGSSGGKLQRARASLLADSLERKVAQAALRERLLTQAFIEVRGAAQAGVTIQLGTTRLTLERAESGTRFSMDLESHTIRSERIAP